MDINLLLNSINRGLLIQQCKVLNSRTVTCQITSSIVTVQKTANQNMQPFTYLYPFWDFHFCPNLFWRTGQFSNSDYPNYAISVQIGEVGVFPNRILDSFRFSPFFGLIGPIQITDLGICLFQRFGLFSSVRIRTDQSKWLSNEIASKKIRLLKLEVR